jgi:riboflavin biosynthesis pyrimidine reductase
MLRAADEEIGAERFVERLALREAWPAADRPRVAAVMVGSLDGHATIDGRAGKLGNPADRAVLREMRAAADVLLVGPGTLIAERYATVLDPEQRERRERGGLSPEPLVVTISRSLDPRLADVPLLSEPQVRVEVMTESDGELPGLAPGVDVVRFGLGELSVRACLRHLRERHGAVLVVTEGGPTLLRGMFAEGLVDDLVLTLAPLMVAGGGHMLLHGDQLESPERLALSDAARSGDHLFLHYRPAA